jgi:hypothetical protein
MVIPAGTGNQLTSGSGFNNTTSPGRVVRLRAAGADPAALRVRAHGREQLHPAGGHLPPQ